MGDASLTPPRPTVGIPVALQVGDAGHALVRARGWTDAHGHFTPGASPAPQGVRYVVVALYRGVRYDADIGDIAAGHTGPGGQLHARPRRAASPDVRRERQSLIDDIATLDVRYARDQMAGMAEADYRRLRAAEKMRLRAMAQRHGD